MLGKLFFVFDLVKQFKIYLKDFSVLPNKLIWDIPEFLSLQGVAWCLTFIIYLYTKVVPQLLPLVNGGGT